VALRTDRLERWRMMKIRAARRRAVDDSVRLEQPDAGDKMPPR